MITPISLKAVLLITLIKMIKSMYMIKMITSISPRGAFFGEAGGWERPLFFLPEEKVFYYHFFNIFLSARGEDADHCRHQPLHDEPHVPHRHGLQSETPVAGFED